MKVERCVDFSLKMHQKRLTAGLRPDPLGELDFRFETKEGEWKRQEEIT